MKVNKYNRTSREYGIGAEYINRTCSDYVIAGNVFRNGMYYIMERTRPSQSSMDHFFHKPYAKWEGNV